MMRIVVMVMVLATLQLHAQDQKTRDREAILAMGGSYVVSFHFKETVGFQMGYTLKPAKDSAGLEEVFVVEDSETRISLQHVLQTPRGIVKHWRHDWEYEPQFLWEFQTDQTWKKRQLTPEEAKGQWVQRVYQVDDSPRYEALGSWSHIGNLSQWTSQPTRRPLPRREYTTRDDYNVMIAQNRHALTPTGWVHEQDNYKLREDENGMHVVSREFGLNSYNHTDSKKLADAVAWWDENGLVWQDIRAVWQDVYNREDLLVIAARVEDKPLHRHLSRLAREMVLAGNYQSEETRRQVRDVIKLFRSLQPEPAAETAGR